MGFYTDKQVAVLGGAGLVGSQLVELLLEDEAEVSVIDDFSRGRRSNISSLPCQITEADIWEGAELLRIFAWHSFDVVFNLAARVTGMHYNKDHHAEMFWENMQLQMVPLRLAWMTKVPYFLQCSTVCVYPREMSYPVGEEEGHVGEPEPTNAGYGWAKRMGERLAQWAAREHTVRVGITRFSNCLHPDETVWVHCGDNVQLVRAEALWNMCMNSDVEVEVMSNEDGFYKWKLLGNCLRLKNEGVMIQIKTKYGRSIAVTPDHKLLTKHGWLMAKHLSRSDYLALCRLVPAAGGEPRLLPTLPLREPEHWVAAVPNPQEYGAGAKGLILREIERSGRYVPDKRYRNGHADKHLWSYIKRNRFPLTMIPDIPLGSILYPRHSKVGIPAYVEITPDILWLLGFYVAEGCHNYNPKNNSHVVVFASGEKFLQRASRILKSVFPGSRPRIVWGEQGPSLRVHGKAIPHLLFNMLKIRTGCARQKTLPSWVLDLPPESIRHVLSGMYDGDGLKSKRDQGWFSYSTTSQKLAKQVLFILAKFGLVGSLNESRSVLNGRDYGAAYTVGAFGLDSLDIATWGYSIGQRIQSRQENEVVWAPIKSIVWDTTPEFVYDLYVPGSGNFVTGDLITAHNCFGPRDYYDDETSHVIPALIKRILGPDDVCKIYGSGQQIREFLYSRDAALGCMKVLEHYPEADPVNIGRPENRITINDLARLIQDITGVKKTIYNVMGEYPEGYPKRGSKIDKLVKKTGWRPQTGLREGLEKAIQWYMENKEIA